MDQLVTASVWQSRVNNLREGIRERACDGLFANGGEAHVGYILRPFRVDAVTSELEITQGVSYSLRMFWRRGDEIRVERTKPYSDI